MKTTPMICLLYLISVPFFGQEPGEAAQLTLEFLPAGVYLMQVKMPDQIPDTNKGTGNCGVIDTILPKDVQQSGMVVKVIKTLVNLPYSMDAAPNPTGDLLLITVTDTEAKHFRYVLYNKDGKILEQDELESKVSAINMKIYPAGLYLLKVMKQDQEIKTFEVVKH